MLSDILLTLEQDVAVTMGIVPEDEHILGYEGAGLVRRVGRGVTNFKVGDRVAVCANGCFANRNQVWKEQVHLLPDWLSFEVRQCSRKTGI